MLSLPSSLFWQDWSSFWWLSPHFDRFEEKFSFDLYVVTTNLSSSLTGSSHNLYFLLSLKSNIRPSSEQYIICPILPSPIQLPYLFCLVKKQVIFQNSNIRKNIENQLYDPLCPMKWYEYWTVKHQYYNFVTQIEML